MIRIATTAEAFAALAATMLLGRQPNRNIELFSALHRRTHLASAARPTGRTLGLHSRPPRLISAAWKCSHAQATCDW
jgi:hypothetical protein